MGRVTAITLISTKTRVFFLRGFTSCYLAGLSRFESGQLMAKTSWDSLLLTSIRHTTSVATKVTGPWPCGSRRECVRTGLHGRAMWQKLKCAQGAKLP